MAHRQVRICTSEDTGREYRRIEGISSDPPKNSQVDEVQVVALRLMRTFEFDFEISRIP
jgi:hypothetical protein